MSLQNTWHRTRFHVSTFRWPDFSFLRCTSQRTPRSTCSEIGRMTSRHRSAADVSGAITPAWSQSLVRLKELTNKKTNHFSIQTIDSNFNFHPPIEWRQWYHFCRSHICNGWRTDIFEYKVIYDTLHICYLSPRHWFTSFGIGSSSFGRIFRARLVLEEKWSNNLWYTKIPCGTEHQSKLEVYSTMNTHVDCLLTTLVLAYDVSIPHPVQNPASFICDAGWHVSTAQPMSGKVEQCVAMATIAEPTATGWFHRRW